MKLVSHSLYTVCMFNRLRLNQLQQIKFDDRRNQSTITIQYKNLSKSRESNFACV